MVLSVQISFMADFNLGKNLAVRRGRLGSRILTFFTGLVFSFTLPHSLLMFVI